MIKNTIGKKWIKGPWRDWVVPFQCNTWFQLGFALVTIGLFCMISFWISSNSTSRNLGVISIFIGVSILGFTEFGCGTVRGYRRARRIIGQGKTFKYTAQKIAGKKPYCYRAGARAAVRKLAPSQKMIPSLANRWWPI